MMRLQKYLAACGVASRREAERLIEAGHVRVNGQPAELGSSVDPSADQITFDGRPVMQECHVYVLLNKPKGVVTSAKDTHNRPTVIDSIEGVPGRVFPIGRLDMDVEGALLLTNDGELAYRLMHPKFEVEKIYIATVRGQMMPQTARLLEKGVELEDGRTAPATVTILKAEPKRSIIRLTLREGRKREVKRMCEAIGHPVQQLRRVSFAGIDIGPLRPGDWRYLDANEVGGLFKLTGIELC